MHEGLMSIKSPLFLVSYCRPGFEKDCQKELESLYSKSWGSKVVGPSQAGWVRMEASAEASRLIGVCSEDLIFSRQVFIGSDITYWKEGDDRVSPMVSGVIDVLKRLNCELLYNEVLFEYPDTNDGKSLSRFAKKLEKPVENALKRTGFKKVYSRKDLPRLHFFLLDYNSGIAGVSFPGQSSIFPMGIPRFKVRDSAPSRSALKLEEALSVFLNEHQQQDLFADGMYGVDLGAAPGGWSGELVRRGVFVTAVDHASLDSRLLASGMVDHVKEDAFRFRPKKRVDWLVCDMVEKPSRVVGLLLEWLKQNWFYYAVVNLKLPMKMRFEELQKLLKRLETEGAELGLTQLRAKHLYHDREEITLFLVKR